MEVPQAWLLVSRHQRTSDRVGKAISGQTQPRKSGLFVCAASGNFSQLIGAMSQLLGDEIAVTSHAPLPLAA
jgi:hypothetical protein